MFVISITQKTLFIGDGRFLGERGNVLGEGWGWPIPRQNLPSLPKNRPSHVKNVLCVLKNISIQQQQILINVFTSVKKL